MSIKIEKAKLSDSSFIVECQLAMALETEGMKLEKSVVEKGVMHVFQKDFGFYVIAEELSKPVGCLLILKEWSDWRNGDVWWIHSLYIEKDYRNKGIFKSMFEFVKSLARESECRGLRLYVDKTNTKAQVVYEKLGMNKNHYELFEVMF